MIRNTIIFNSLNQNKTSGPTLSVTPSSLSFDTEGGFDNLSVTVATSSQVWAVTDSETWLSITGASLIGNDSFRVTCDAQPSGEQPIRTGTVTVSSSGCTDVVINITQAARAA